MKRMFVALALALSAVVVGCSPTPDPVEAAPAVETNQVVERIWFSDNGSYVGTAFGWAYFVQHSCQTIPNWYGHSYTMCFGYRRPGWLYNPREYGWIWLEPNGHIFMFVGTGTPVGG